MDTESAWAGAERPGADPLENRAELGQRDTPTPPGPEGAPQEQQKCVQMCVCSEASTPRREGAGGAKEAQNELLSRPEEGSEWKKEDTNTNTGRKEESLEEKKKTLSKPNMTSLRLHRRFTPRYKVKVGLWIDADLWHVFKRIIYECSEEWYHGILSEHVENALREYIEPVIRRCEETLTHTNAHKNTKHVRDRVLAAYIEVWGELQRRLGVLQDGARVSETWLRRAISAVRGGDERTVRKWIRLFMEQGHIRDQGGIWELHQPPEEGEK
ncbi:MAG: hypothetical protein QXR17_00120 [Candidatus Bathyarchaeia archaeon]